VVQHLRAWIDYSNIDASVCFWRTRAGNEVDFVVYGESVFCALEVKSAARVKAEHLRGLKAFQQDYPQCKAALLYMGKERLRIDGVLCMPCAEFLMNLVPGQDVPIG
jgi:predicted AAA+ superfamily ATPase